MIRWLTIQFGFNKCCRNMLLLRRRKDTASPGDLHIVGGFAGAAPFSCLPRLKPHTRNERWQTGNSGNCVPWPVNCYPWLWEIASRDSCSACSAGFRISYLVSGVSIGIGIGIGIASLEWLILRIAGAGDGAGVCRSVWMSAPYVA